MTLVGYLKQIKIVLLLLSYNKLYLKKFDILSCQLVSE